MKKWFDKKKSPWVKFELGDLVIKWDEDRAKPRCHQNFDSLWIEPYIIKDAL